MVSSPAPTSATLATYFTPPTTPALSATSVTPALISAHLIKPLYQVQGLIRLLPGLQVYDHVHVVAETLGDKGLARRGT